jgi:Putative prokaryotic signal transducing protein
MVPLTTAANPLAARILAAHLGAEGIVWELRGNVDGPYPIGPVEVLVAEEDLAVARQVVVEQEPDALDPLDPLDDPDAVHDHDRAVRTPRARWVLLAAVVLVAAVILSRLLLVTAL